LAFGEIKFAFRKRPKVGARSNLPVAANIRPNLLVRESAEVAFAKFYTKMFSRPSSRKKAVFERKSPLIPSRFRWRNVPSPDFIPSSARWLTGHPPLAPSSKKSPCRLLFASRVCIFGYLRFHTPDGQATLPIRKFDGLARLPKVCI